MDVVLSEYLDKSHNFTNLIFVTSHFSTLWYWNFFLWKGSGGVGVHKVHYGLCENARLFNIRS